MNGNTDSMLEIFDRLTTSAFLVDRDLSIVHANQAACAAFVYTPEEIMSRRLPDLLMLEGAASEAVLQDAAAPSQAVCRKKNGDFFSAKVSLHPLGDSGRLVVVQDVSGEQKLRQKASQRTKELFVFNTFASILTSHKDAATILRATVDMLLNFMDADAAWIYLVEDESGEIILEAERGFAPGFIEKVSRLKPGECFSGKVFSSGRPLLVKKAADDPRVSFRAEGIESMTGVPITSRDVLLGVLGLASTKPAFFTAMDVQLLSTIGSQLGVAIENLRLIRQLREKMRHIELTNELSGIINSSLSIGTVFRIMVSEIGKLIHYSRASLLLYDEHRDGLLIFALDTEMNTVMKKGVKAPISGTSAGWVIRNNKPWINTDLRTLQFPLDKKLLDEGIRSTISIPLFRDKVLGVFNLDSTEPSQYSERDLQILLPAAKHMSIALENALLFEEITREKREWEKTFDAITDMVWIEDGGRRVLRANGAVLARSGLSAHEIPGKLCCELLGAIGLGAAGCLCEETLSRKTPSFVEVKGEKGNIFHSWSYPLLNDGQLYAVVHYLKDVTDQKRLEQQLVRSERLASLGTLVAGIAHEINNPLGIIAGYSEALLERAKEESLRSTPEFEDFPEYLETIHNEIFRCKDILRGLLDFARPSSGTLREIDINELIKEVILLVNHRAKRLNHNVELLLNRELPKLQADPGSLRQLFMNVIINSLYFTPASGRIVITSDLDDDGAGLHGQWIRVSVADTGTGIPQEVLGKVFNPFFTTKQVGEGTGLGLAICHRIVEEHGGVIDIESEEGRGTTISIRFSTNGPAN